MIKRKDGKDDELEENMITMMIKKTYGKDGD